MTRYASGPNPDKLALLRTGLHVRRRLDGNPGVDRVPVEGADIWTVAQFITPDECAELIAQIDASAVPSQTLSHGYAEEWRTSSSGNLDPSDPLVTRIEQRIDNLLGLPHEWGETLQGQRYEPGQQFREHMDWFWTKADYWPQESRNGGQRSFTAMAFLSEVEAGGTTDFPTLGLSIPPQPGGLIVWNNASADGNPNELTLHAGMPVERGVKHIITKWYRTRKWG